MVLLGIGTAMVTIPVMSEIMEAIEQHPKWKGKFNEFVMQNNVSGYFIVCQALGETVGPLTSSSLRLHLHFRPAQQMMGLIVTTFLIAYIGSCGVAGFFRKNFSIQQKTDLGQRQILEPWK